MPGSEKLATPHKEAEPRQADPRIINEVLQYFGWDRTKPVNEQTANRHALDYLQARYNEPGVTITDLVGRFMSEHDAHSVGAVEQMLLREVQVSTIVNDEANFFFIEPFLTSLYEKHNGAPIDAGLDDAERRRTLAEFWVTEYAEPMNNRMNHTTNTCVSVWAR